MGRLLPSLLIGTARVPPRRSLGKAELARALSALDTGGAAAQNILLVRHLRCSEPTRDIRLEKRVAQRLADSRRRAVCPQCGVVPEGAEAILFANTAELLACLLRVGDGHPWWRNSAARLLGRLSTPAELCHALAEYATYIPAVISLLTAWVGPTKAVTRIEQFDIAMLTKAVAHVWDIPLYQVGPLPERRMPLAEVTVDGPGPSPSYVPSNARACAFVEAALILASHRAAPSKVPSIAHALSFASGVSPEWVRTEHNPLFRVTAQSNLSPPASHIKAIPQGTTPQARKHAATSEGSQTPAYKLSTRRTLGTNAPQKHVPTIETAPQYVRQKFWSRTAAPEDAPAPQSAPPAPLAQAKKAPVSWTPSDDALDERTALLPVVPLPRQVLSNLGGVFFLWHLCRAMNLPVSAGDWRMPDAVGPWGLIEAFARALLWPRTMDQDPIWVVLAELDGRDPDTLIGSAMRRPRDVAPQPDPRQIPGIAPVFAEWLTHYLPALQDRLAQALDCASTEASDFLHRPAQIDLAPAEITVTFAHADADTATRRAGLDVDPGWVPELGHIVRFCYV